MSLTIADIKRKNREAGQYFFEPATMRFFDSRVLPGVYQGPGGVYFITSEQFHGSNGYHGARLYTVRQFMPDGSIDTVGEHQEYTYLSRAREAARQLARQQAEQVPA